MEEVKNLSFATKYEIDDTFDNEKFIKMRIMIMHSGINPNLSNFNLDVIDKAKDSIKNIPILAHVITDENGEKQFGSHDYNLEMDESQGKYRLVYYEQPIGLIPENNKYAIEEYNGLKYVVADAFIWKGYSNYAEQIIERDENIKVSMEILVDKYKMMDNGIIDIQDYKYTGVTFLGNDLETGMLGANAQKIEFSSNDKKEEFIKIANELKFALENQLNNEENEVVESMVDETKTVVNEEVKEEQFEQAEEVVESENTDEVVEVAETVEENNEIIVEDNNSTEEIVDEFDYKIAYEELKNKYENEEKFMKIYELSHDDIRSKLYQVLYSIEEADEEWYWISNIYYNYFEYENDNCSKCFRQKYVKTETDIAFDGGRVELFIEKLTKEEKDSLDEIRANYSIIQSENKQLKEFKQNIEEKQEVEKLNNEIDEIVSEFSFKEEEIKELKNKALKSELSLDEFRKELFVLEGMKHHQSKKNFSQQQKEDETKIKISSKNIVEKPYGAFSAK